MIEKLKRQLENVRKLGFRAAAAKFYHDHIYAVDHVLHLTRRLDEAYPLKRIKMKDIEVFVCTTVDECSPLMAAYPERSSYFKDYVDLGCTAIYGIRDGEILGYVWVATSDFYDQHLYRRKFSIRSNQIYQFAGYVEPKFRGKPVSLVIMNEANAYFFDNGFVSTLAVVSVFNSKSMKFHSKLRFRATGEAFESVKFLWWRWSRPAEPRDDIKMFPSAQDI